MCHVRKLTFKIKGYISGDHLFQGIGDAIFISMLRQGAEESCLKQFRMVLNSSAWKYDFNWLLLVYLFVNVLISSGMVYLAIYIIKTILSRYPEREDMESIVLQDFRHGLI